jgi:hypothetical protein
MIKFLARVKDIKAKYVTHESSEREKVREVHAKKKQRAVMSERLPLVVT